FINGKFTLSDGNTNTLNIGGFMQNRYFANVRDTATDSEDFTHGFQISRARLKFNGSIWDKKFTYNIMTELSTSTGSATLLDAEGRYTFDNKMYIRAGQFKPMFNREENVIDINQLTVERSLVNSVFSLSRAQGIGFGWGGEKVRVAADIHDGGSSLNTAFDSSKEADFAITSRVDWMFAGDNFKRFDDFTSFKGSGYAGMLGAAIDWETYGDTGGGAASRDILGATVDAMVEGNGWNAFVGALYRTTSPDAADDVTDWGLIAQLGVFVTEQTELFARYDVVMPDDSDGPDDFSTFTVGANYYVSPQSHAVKVTGDVVYFPDAEANSALIPAPARNANLLTDTEGDQFGVRLQLQVVF
ncbi:MAG: porin, partial [Planctomycetota bacterium]|nr:porin [Planctomycetota bacterium]